MLNPISELAPRIKTLILFESFSPVDFCCSLQSLHITLVPPKKMISKRISIIIMERGIRKLRLYIKVVNIIKNDPAITLLPIRRRSSKLEYSQKRE